MRSIANRYISEIEKPGKPLPSLKQIKNNLVKLRHVLLYGTLSIGLYTLMYFFSKDLINIAQDAHQGYKLLFFVPIIVALVFSFVHGSFTSHFWDVLGVKAKKP